MRQALAVMRVPAISLLVPNVVHGEHGGIVLGGDE